MKKEFIKQELEKLANKHGGILKPEVVVAAARSEKSPLHDCFDWDDSSAAEKYRLWQARQLIVYVDVVEADREPYQAYVSLSTDRKEGGYRFIHDVLNDDEYRAILLTDALNEMTIFKNKYHTLKELARVFEEMDVVVEKHKAPVKARMMNVKVERATA